jgi:hypothetical protein
MQPPGLIPAECSSTGRAGQAGVEHDAAVTTGAVRSRRGKLTADKLAALAGLGLE